jgi:hypothetical protein
MDRTLVKSLHIGDPDVLGYTLCGTYVHVGLFGKKQMQLQAYPGDPTYELLLLAKCLSVIDWGSHVEVPNSQTNIWLVSSLVECSQAARVRSTAKICLSWGALLEDGENTGQVSTLYLL